jgi:hypothetical protein
MSYQKEMAVVIKKAKPKKKFSKKKFIRKSFKTLQKVISGEKLKKSKIKTKTPPLVFTDHKKVTSRC